MTRDSRSPLSTETRYFVAAFLLLSSSGQFAAAQTLVPSPFVTGFQGWQDTYTTQPTQVGGAPSWGVLLTPDPLTGQQFLMETSDGREADSTVAADGKYKPYMLINSVDTTPANYTLTAQLATLDNDGFGLVFGYQDNNNYFRIGFRDQASGLGFPRGTSVQKVVGGVITQLGTPSLSFVPLTNGTPFEAKVVVTGTNYDVQIASTVGGSFTSIFTGTDANLQAGKYGVHSWAQHELSTAVPNYGTIVGPVTVASASLNKTTNFTNVLTGAVPWRRLVMVDQNGETGFSPSTENVLEDHGNFMLDFTKGVIRDDSNGNKNATTSAPNVDFIGPAIVVDTPAASTMTDYRYAVRVENRDNDGIGLLFRVASDNSAFYRVNWNTEGPAIGVGTGATRPPIGMSVQKFKAGAWSEVYRDTQTSPVFLPTDSRPFDVSIQAVGSQFKIDVVDDPNGTPTTYSYPLITDGSDPILAGSVGFTNWGNGEGDNGAVYSAHNGNSTSLVTALSSLLDLDLIVNRTTGNISLKNSSPSFAAIKGITILSDGGTINAANWLSVTDNYDKAPQNGSVDPNHNWTELSDTDFNLSERDAATNGGSLSGSQTVNLGSIWRKSQIQDLVLSIELANGNVIAGEVIYTNGPGGNAYSRSDLNADGNINAADWGVFFPNMLTNISAQSAYSRAIKGDLDLDGDSDAVDFSLFKLDYDAANGAGAFSEMLAGVPEPATAFLVLIAACAACVSRTRRHVKSIAFSLSATAVLSVASTSHAVPLDLTTFLTEKYPKADAGFVVGDWITTATTASLGSNADATILYTPTNVVNKRITGTLAPGTDDDVVGFVVGFNTGETVIGATGEYFLIDWKGATQAFDFVDSGGGPTFHSLTGTGNMPAGLALSRVNGSANADELWQHVDLAASPSGSVTQLARGATLGATPYDRSGFGTHQFDIAITDHEIIVKVGGVEQFAYAGTFAPGSFGLYSAWQGPTATFSDFDSADFLSDNVLRATVDRSNGSITIDNPNGGSAAFDYYQFSSASGSLKPSDGSWNSLHDQNYQPSGVTDDKKWQEAGGSSTSAIAEVYLDGNSTLAGSTTKSIGSAYNNLINGQDLVFQYRLPNGSLRPGYVQYIGTPPGVQGDYNGNGIVDGADYVLWRKGGALQNDPTPGTQAADYTFWRSRFGATSGSGSGLGGATVPEPTSLGMIVCVALFAVGRGYRTGRQL